MDVRRILLLRLVAQHGSISAAAREAGWTQPALSQHIRMLEAEMGFPLILRTSSGVTLTHIGEILVTHADGIAAHLSAAEQQIAEISALHTGRLRLAAFPSAIAGLLPPVLASLRARIPRIDLHLTEAEPPQAIDQLRRDDADIAIVFSYVDDISSPNPAVTRALGPDASSTDLTWVPWTHDAIQLIVPKDPSARTRLALPTDDTEITFAGCREMPWIAGCERCQSHLMGIARTAGFVPSVWHETDDTVSTQVLVAAGHGVALLPETALVQWKHPGVRAINLPELGRRQIGALVRPALTHVPAIALFLDELHAPST